jgi:hypothetical protein
MKMREALWSAAACCRLPRASLLAPFRHYPRRMAGKPACKKRQRAAAFRERACWRHFGTTPVARPASRPAKSGSKLPPSASELARAISALPPSHGRQAGLQKAAASCRTPKRLRRTHFDGSEESCIVSGAERDSSLRSDWQAFSRQCEIPRRSPRRPPRNDTQTPVISQTPVDLMPPASHPTVALTLRRGVSSMGKQANADPAWRGRRYKARSADPASRGQREKRQQACREGKRQPVSWRSARERLRAYPVGIDHSLSLGALGAPACQGWNAGDILGYILRLHYWGEGAAEAGGARRGGGGKGGEFWTGASDNISGCQHLVNIICFPQNAAEFLQQS